MTSSRMDSDFKYRAFISYSHQDGLWAAWLHKALETYAIPKRLVGQATAAGVIPKRLAPIFRDRDELPSATDLNRKVNEALEQSANLIVICSPRSAASHWVDQEVLAFKRLGRSERIFCLIVDGEPNASDIIGRKAEECFAAALRYRLGADGVLGDERSEPIAADARPGKDGKTNAKLKLISGLLDIGFDALKQRELRRRTQRMAMITAAALLVMAITTTLAITAFIARHAAVVARADAERRQKQAEDLVGFMLGDLGDKLNEVHRLDIMQAVDDKAMAYFDTLPAADATDAALGMRVTALEKIASVRMDQGRIPAARESYHAATVLAAELARRAPHDAARQAAWGDSLKWVGQADWYQGDLAAALENYRAASRLLQQAHAALPADNDLAFKLAAARNNLGGVLETRGSFAAAQAEYEATLALYQELITREPANPKWRSYLGDAWDNLGKLALERGHLDEAIAAYRKDQAIKAALAARASNDHAAQESLLVSNAILGRALALYGDLDAALGYTREAVDSAKALIASDATDNGWQEDSALYGQQLGGLLRQAGQLDAAAAVDTDALHVFDALLKQDHTNADWQQEMAQSRLENARLQLQRGDANAANESATTALAALEVLRTKNADNRNLTLLATHAEILLGKIAAQGDDMAAAQTHWQKARDTIAVAARNGDDPNFLATWATALLLLGDSDTAQGALAKLAGMAYRAPDFVALLAAKNIRYTPDADAQRRIAAAMQSAEP